MFFLFATMGSLIYVQHRLRKSDYEMEYRRSLPMIEAELDRENARLDREISRLLLEHRKLCKR